MEEITLFLKVLFARYASGWIDGHVSQATQRQIISYVWPGLIGVFLLLLLVALIEVKLKTRAEIISSSSVESNSIAPSPVDANSKVQGVSAQDTMGANLGLLFSILRQNYLLKVEPFRIAGPNNLRVSLLISIVALFFAAIDHLPYDFYVLMRVAVFATCAIQFLAMRREQHPIWMGTILLIALLYNPLLPIHLHRPTWEGLNWLTLIIFSVLCELLRPISPASPLIPCVSSSNGLSAGSVRPHAEIGSERKSKLPRTGNKKKSSPSPHA